MHLLGNLLLLAGIIELIFGVTNIILIITVVSGICLLTYDTIKNKYDY